MAALTCQVLGEEDIPLPGAHVVATCKDQCQNVIAIFESFTDHAGMIETWFPSPAPGSPGIIEPVVVDTNLAPRVAMTFLPSPFTLHTMSPWVSMQTDMLLTGGQGHHFILSIKDKSTYYVKHITPSPVMLTVMDVDPEEIDSKRSPSPFRLPSPIFELEAAPEAPKRSRPARRNNGRKRRNDEDEEPLVPQQKRSRGGRWKV